MREHGRGAAAVAISRHHLASLCVVEAFKLVVIRIRKLWKLLFPNCREWMSFFRVENIGAFALEFARAHSMLSSGARTSERTAPNWKKSSTTFRSRVVAQQYNTMGAYYSSIRLRWFSLEEKKAFFFHMP